MQTIEQSREMAKLACEALADKKGEDIRVIDIAGISVLADYFIIANGTNESQVRALVDNVEETLGKAGYEVKQLWPWKLGTAGLWRYYRTCIRQREPSVLRSGKNLERWQTGGSGISVNIFSDVLETDTGDPMLSVL